MAIEEGQFLELEKRLAAFKHVFNTLQTSVHLEAAAEIFETSHQVYLADLINGAVKLSANSSPGDDSYVLPYRTRHWTRDASRETDNLKCLMGTLADPIVTEYTENPYVEKITMPLVRAYGTNQQAYFCFASPDQQMLDEYLFSDVLYSNPTPELDVDQTESPYNWEIVVAPVFQNPERRVKNWIAPTKYGDDYIVQLYPSNEDKSGPDTSTPIRNVDKQESSGAGKESGGWIFDYYQGMLYIAPHPTLGNESPYLAGFKHPLWIVGYHYFGPTGSDMTVTSAGTADSSGGGGGVSTTLTSNPNNAYDVNQYGWYDINTLTATDSEDIIEYVSPDATIIISASYGPRDLIVRLDSSSYNDITADKWPYYDVDDGETYNGANLFKFGDEQYPDYSSYGNFRTTGSDGYNADWITQSFQFSTAKRLSQIGVCYSNDDNTDPSSVPEAATPLSYKYPAAYKLEGSVDDITYEEIVYVASIRTNTLAGIIPRPIGTNFHSFGQDTIDGSQHYWLDDEDDASGPIHIYCATASIADPTRYRYYKLYISGGLATAGEPENIISLHHVDLWQNLDYGPTNRKQLNVKFNDIYSGRDSHITSEPLTLFDVAVSHSAQKLGYTKVLPEGLTYFSGGEIAESIDLGGNLTFTSPTGQKHIKGASQITASIISASTKIITKDIYASNLYGTGSALVFGNISASGHITTDSLTVNTSIQFNSDIAMPSDKKIYLTNRKQDGTIGTDEFSARIFGNYVDSGGVSDMYLDAYRIYTVSDAKMHMRTLHPTLGQIVLQSPQTLISGSLEVPTSINAGSITASHGIQVSGSMLISGSIIPNTGADTMTSSFDLGSSTAAWKDLHISDGTIRFYDGQKEVVNMSVDSTKQVQFKSGSEFQKIRVSEINIGPILGSSVQISDDGRGFIAVSKNGSNSTILRAEDQSMPALGYTADSVHGSLTQKGSGSFAIILDAVNQNEARSKFSIISNSELFDTAQTLFQVSESGETKVYGYLNVSQSINAYNISANSFTGIFAGALSGSDQISTDISGAFTAASSSLQTRLTNVEAGSTSKTLISGSSQIASAISGSITIASASLAARVASLEVFESTNPADIDSAVLEYQGIFSSSFSVRTSTLENNEVFTSTMISGSFHQPSASIASRLSSLNSKLQPILDVTSSYVITNTNVLFNEMTASYISASSIVVGTISASNFHTTIFNPSKITTTELTTSYANLGNVLNTRTFTTDDFNTLFAASTRPTLTIRNAGGSDITYYGNPVDNADAFIKFQSDRSDSHYAVGIDSHDGDFKITSGSSLNANSAGDTGYPTFRIQDNKVGIVKGSTVSYTLDVGGDIRSTGTIRADKMKGQTALGDSIVIESNITASGGISASNTITANAFIGDGSGLTNLSGISGSFTSLSGSLSDRISITEISINGGTF